MTQHASGDDAKRTLKMGVANVGFMVDRLGRDCHPLQYVRELTQNAIEANEARDGGEIVWDVDWNYFDLTGQYKLAVIDNGVGMTGEEMLRYINQLSSSTHVQAHDGNYGVGAKIAAATRNHAGLLYLSWKDGQGWMTHLWRDPTIDEYGARRFDLPDGSYGDYLTIQDDLKPDLISGDHGTMVVLLGNSDDANTVEPDAESGVSGRQRWITKYLNTRYFRFPGNIEVKVREGYDTPRDDSRRNFLRKVTGMEQFLKDESDWYGSVPLSDATAHVWILNEREERTKVGDMFATTGHVAALHKNELYEMKTGGRGAPALLQQFGVIFGYGRIVIYVEPEIGPSGSLHSNTARTQLLRNGEPLPWDDWAAEFREHMPQEVKDHMERIAAASTSEDHQQAIRERLKAIRDLFKVSRYRRVREGLVDVSDAAPGGASSPGKGSKRRKGGSGPGGGRGGSVYAQFAASGGVEGEEVANPDPIPLTKWVSIKDGTREGDDLEDRAAKFIPEQNLLLINADFRVFSDMVKRWAKQYDGIPGARDVIEETVHEWFEQALVETVVGAQGLQGSAQWPADDLEKIWSEEGLTAAVLQRYHVDVNVKRTVGTKLGSLKAKTMA
jgi:hypothetical protein